MGVARCDRIDFGRYRRAVVTHYRPDVGAGHYQGEPGPSGFADT